MLPGVQREAVVETGPDRSNSIPTFEDDVANLSPRQLVGSREPCWSSTHDGDIGLDLRTGAIVSHYMPLCCGCVMDGHHRRDGCGSERLKRALLLQPRVGPSGIRTSSLRDPLTYLEVRSTHQSMAQVVIQKRNV